MLGGWRGAGASPGAWPFEGEWRGWGEASGPRTRGSVHMSRRRGPQSALAGGSGGSVGDGSSLVPWASVAVEAAQCRERLCAQRGVTVFGFGPTPTSEMEWATPDHAVDE